MISIYVEEVDGTCFGVAYAGEKIVATTVNSAEERTMKSLLRSIPFNVEHQIVNNSSGFAERTILMLRELCAGNEENKSFAIATEYFPEPVARVLTVAAAIPIGYVASYGSIAKTADTGPRVVGKIMAANPLYPIVSCHRVVGADFSLVGYGGRKSLQALQAKLARLSKEARGFTTKKEVPVNGKRLTVYPVEYVIKKAEKQGLGSSRQQRLFDNRKPENMK